MTTRLVIAKYQEDVSWLRKIKNHNITVYDKSDSPIEKSIQLNNVGREGHTFLHHIVTNYNNLDDITIFLQGNPFEHIQVLKGWQYFGLPGAKYPPKLTENELNDVCQKMNEEINAKSSLSSFYQVVYNDPNMTNSANVRSFVSYLLDINIDSDVFTVSPGGQYIVPKKYILNTPLCIWKKALDLLETNIGWYGYAMELSWFYLFTNKVGNFGNHDYEKKRLDGEKKYGFHHRLNTLQDLSIY